MKKNCLLFLLLISNYLSYSQNYFTEHLINQPLSQPVQIKSADIDGDGDKDFAVISTGGELTWHEQISNTYWETHYISMDVNGYSLAISDLDGDSKLDIIATHSFNANSGQISWFKNDGNQNFTQTILSNSNIASGSNKTLVVDIDNDNDKDIISSIAGSIVILRNDGNENFINETTSIDLGNGSLNENTNDIEIIDFDNDGLLDFVVTTRGSDGVNWYKQNSNNTFTNTIIATGTYVNIAVGDIDNDNDYDIITTRDNSTSGPGNEIVTFLNSGDNSSFSSVVFLSLYTELSYLNLADIDSNGYLDIVYFGGEPTNQYERAIRTILNPATTFITEYPKIYNSSYYADINNSSNYVEFILDDINQDSKIDIIQLNGGIGRINYYQNVDVNLSTYNFILHEVSNSCGNVNDLSISDLNNDSSLDVLVSSLHEHTLESFSNSGDNINFTNNIIDGIPKQYYSKNKIIDIDGDGDKDILSVNKNGGSEKGFYLYYYNGSSYSVITLQQINNGGELPENINYGDIDNDGDIDIITISTHYIYLLVNNGNSYDPPISLNNNSSLNSEIFDVDNDNYVDIILNHNNSLGYLKNNGNNTFSSFISFKDLNNNDISISNGTGNLYNFKYIDFDNDSDFDVVGIGANLLLFRNDGTNKYEEISLIQSQYRAGRDIEIVDIDDDNDNDIIVGGNFGVYWAKNDNSTFTRQVISANSEAGTGTGSDANAFGVEIADMDDDGDFDVVYTSYTGNKVAWLENKIEETLSTTNVSLETNIKIYPNPTSSILTIDTNHSIEIESIKLYNIQGRVIKTYQNTNTIDITTLESGMYLLNILYKKGTITKQIIKQ